MNHPRETVTFELGAAELIVPAKDLLRAWLQHELADAPTARPQRTALEVPVLADGEIYAGVIIGEDGAPSHHLILLPGEAEKITWKGAVVWAEKAGGELPSSHEQALLYANCKKHFQSDWYWSSTQHASASDCAWGQYFYDGHQDHPRKSYEGRARAVRRLSI